MRWIVLGICAAIMLGAGPLGAKTESELDAEALARLNGARDWLIEQGIAGTQQHGAQFLKDHVFQKWTVLLWATPLVQSNGILAQFRIKARGAHYDIQSLYQANSGGIVYDFWMIQKSSADWATPMKGCEFRITKANSDNSRATVLESKTFIPEFQAHSGETIQFPQQDLAVLYDLRAWQFPECFEGYRFKDYEILLDENGAYSSRPYQP